MADGGRQSGRQLYAEEAQYSLPGKLHISSNFMLRFPAQDQAIRDRLVVIAYKTRFVMNPCPTNELEVACDPTAAELIIQDSDAVGTWMAIGAKKAIADINKFGRIPIPQVIQNETTAEIRKIDVIHSFVEVNTNICPSITNRVASERLLRDVSRLKWSYEKTQMYNDFKKHAQATGGVERWDLATFNVCLERYFQMHRVGVGSYQHAGEYYWHGIAKYTRKEEQEEEVNDGEWPIKWVNQRPS